MAYGWAQLAFVEKWRLHSVRGQIVGMHRPADVTFFDLRLRPGEGNAGQLPGTVDLHLQDAGDIVREKRYSLMDRATVIVMVAASIAAPESAGPGVGPAAGRGRSRRWLEPGVRVSGQIVEVDPDAVLLDAGLPLLVRFRDEADAAACQPGRTLQITILETPRGFLVV